MSATQVTRVSGDCYKGDEFFSKSPFRSARFVAVSMLSAVVIVADVGVMVFYWDRLSPSAVIWLAILAYQGAFGSIYRAYRQHETINELYLVGKITDVPLGSALQAALDVAATAVYNGLIALPFVILGYLWLLVYFLRHTR